ncbi:MAG: VacJ family lipoprotein, partial [Massilia sp.]|nr:VacJ family lipoprotein [Massilia sp.]
KADPWAYKEPVKYRNIGIAVRAVDQRATLLDASNLLEEAALDRYEFIRDGFLQRRESRIYDGGSKPQKRSDKDEAPSDAKSIKAAYADDPGATPDEAPAAKAAPSPTVTPTTSSDAAQK